MYKNAKLLQYARENLAEFAEFMFKNDVAKNRKTPAKIGFYIKDSKGGLWGKNGDVFYYIPRDESLSILYPYNYNRCYRMPYVYRKYDSLVSFELLMNNYLSGNKKGELNEGQNITK